MKIRIWATAAAAILGAWGIGATANAQAAPPGADTLPTPGWAHLSGRVHLLPLGAADTTNDVSAKLLIEETYARWGIAYDEGLTDVVKSLFTPDALFEVAKGSGKAFVSVRGPDAIAKSVAAAVGHQHDQRRHAISNIVFDRLTPTEASTIAYGLVAVAANGVSLGSTVIYSAELRRGADGQWRFDHLFVGMDDYAGTTPN